MARSRFVESFDLAQNGDNSIDENGQHFDGEGIQSPGYGITPSQYAEHDLNKTSNTLAETLTALVLMA